MSNSSPVVHFLLVHFGVVLVVVTGVNQSQLLVTGLRLKYDNIVFQVLEYNKKKQQFFLCAKKVYLQKITIPKYAILVFMGAGLTKKWGKGGSIFVHSLLRID